MAVPTGRESDKFMLRLPDGMRDDLKRLAEANKRSMNAEIVAALEAHLRPRFVIDTGPPLNPEDFDADEEYDPADDPINSMTPEVRAAMEHVVQNIADDARRRINELLWLERHHSKK